MLNGGMKQYVEIGPGPLVLHNYFSVWSLAEPYLLVTREKLEQVRSSTGVLNSRYTEVQVTNF